MLLKNATKAADDALDSNLQSLLDAYRQDYNRCLTSSVMMKAPPEKNHRNGVCMAQYIYSSPIYRR